MIKNGEKLFRKLNKQSTKSIKLKFEKNGPSFFGS